MLLVSLTHKQRNDYLFNHVFAYTQGYREIDVESECDEIRAHVVSFITPVKNRRKWSFVSADHLRLDH